MHVVEGGDVEKICQHSFLGLGEKRGIKHLGRGKGGGKVKFE